MIQLNQKSSQVILNIKSLDIKLNIDSKPNNDTLNELSYIEETLIVSILLINYNYN